MNVGEEERTRNRAEHAARESLITPVQTAQGWPPAAKALLVVIVCLFGYVIWTMAAHGEFSRPSASMPVNNTSPEAGPNLKGLKSNILPVRFNNSRNVGGDVGDNLGAGLWLSAEAAGYKCHETEAYGSPSVNSLMSDLKTDLENNNYSYTEIERLGDKETGEIITWKATGDITAIGFFATLADGAGSMAICRATPQ